MAQNSRLCPAPFMHKPCMRFDSIPEVPSNGALVKVKLIIKSVKHMPLISLTYRSSTPGRTYHRLGPNTRGTIRVTAATRSHFRPLRSDRQDVGSRSSAILSMTTTTSMRRWTSRKRRCWRSLKMRERKVSWQTVKLCAVGNSERMGVWFKVNLSYW